MRKRVFKRKKKTNAKTNANALAKALAKAAAFAAALSLMLGTVMTAYGEEAGSGAGSAVLKTVVTDIFHRHIGSPDTGGGCYTNPIEHKHQGDSVNGGGCYTRPVIHEHTGSPETGGGCYGNVIPHTQHGPECYISETHTHESSCLSGRCTITYIAKELIETYTDTCQIHGATTHERRAAIASHNNCGLGEVDAVIEQCQSCTNALTRTHTYINCGKQEGTTQVLVCSKTIDGYGLSCGYEQGRAERYELECDGAPDGYGLGCGLGEDRPCGRLILTSQAGSESTKVVISARVEDLTGGRLVLSSDPYVWKDQEGNILGSGESLEVEKNGDYSVTVRLENKDVDESGLHSSISVDGIHKEEPETPAATPTATASATPTASAEPTVTPTASAEPTATPTASAEPTVTPTASAEPTATPTASAEPTATPTASAEPTATPSASAEPIATPTASTEPTAAPSAAIEPSTVPSATPSASTVPAESPKATPPAASSPGPVIVPERTPEPSAVTGNGSDKEEGGKDSDEGKQEDGGEDENQTDETEKAGEALKENQPEENQTQENASEDESGNENNRRLSYYDKRDRSGETSSAENEEEEEALASPSPAHEEKIKKDTAAVTVSGNSAAREREYRVGRQTKKDGFFQSTAAKIITVALSTILIIAGLILLLLYLLCSVRVFNDDGEGRMIYLGRLLVRKKDEEYSLVITEAMTEKSCTNRYCIKPGLFRLGKKEGQELIVYRDTKKAVAYLSKEMIVIL